jgi:hypothetical protein
MTSNHPLHRAAGLPFLAALRVVRMSGWVRLPAGGR